MKAEIEAYLLTRRTWVSATALSLRFHVPERKYRQARGKPGLLSEFAVSNTKKGYRHILCATDGEFLHHYRAQRKHAIMSMVRVRNQARERREAQRRREEAARIEGGTGQRLMAV